tara:strand:- start:86477 stop:86674 length:198 start_codon:yes stop_codon:yes gene_type:complete
MLSNKRCDVEAPKSSSAAATWLAAMSASPVGIAHAQQQTLRRRSPEVIVSGGNVAGSKRADLEAE